MMNPDQLLSLYSRFNSAKDIIHYSKEPGPDAMSLKGVAGSAAAILAASSVRAVGKSFLFVLADKESAAYFFNDLENLLGEKDHSYENRRIFLFPSAYRKPYEYHETNNANVLLRAEVVNRLATEKSATIVVTYPAALSEKVVSHKQLSKNMFSIHQGEILDIDFFLDMLLEYGFEQADFVVEPGTFCIRGGIMDVFSFSNDFPYRIEIMGNTVESLRSFNPETQLSVKVEKKISILPDIEKITQSHDEREWLLESMPTDTLVWIDDLDLSTAIIQESFDRAQQVYETLHKDIRHTKPSDMFLDAITFTKKLQQTRLLEFRRAKPSDSIAKSMLLNCKPQPSFNKNFELFFKTIESNTRAGIRNYIISENPKQIDRIQAIFETIVPAEDQQDRFILKSIVLGLHEGFIDTDNKIAVFTDHQIFERYHRFRLRDKFTGKQALNIKELSNLKPGDYVTHIDHGIGIFSGLEKIEVNGKIQEAIRLIYKDEDILYISIHSLHRISKYSGKEGSIPSLHRLGSNAWSNLKNKTKNKVKDIAKDLIRLYAQRRAKEGFSFSADTYLQKELEASFIFEDTPDQETSTVAVKKDMEAKYPMDRLICGDVGFGKTEIAIRAAFKAVSDSKQVAILVPTTILALQHFYTFSERLRDFPCTIDYVSRFRSIKDQKEVFKKLASGQLDILIGTHKLVNKDIRFKDLGLLIIDEEQKFGVSTKEKLKQMKVDVDTLTLTATPIPRTLQFSLMGARDLSLINTPPPNRYPIITELHVFDEALIRDAIMYEVTRGGQVFFVHNRVQNITELAGVVQRLCPDLRMSLLATGNWREASLNKLWWISSMENMMYWYPLPLLSLVLIFQMPIPLLSIMPTISD
jgi:transcription-repair coupling factor (superfamily II helicase)